MRELQQGKGLSSCIFYDFCCEIAEKVDDLAKQKVFVG